MKHVLIILIIATVWVNPQFGSAHWVEAGGLILEQSTESQVKDKLHAVVFSDTQIVLCVLVESFLLSEVLPLVLSLEVYANPVRGPPLV